MSRGRDAPEPRAATGGRTEPGESSAAPRLREIARAAEHVSDAERQLAAAIHAARQAGVTWQEVGDVLGVSRQAAFKRFGRPVDPDTGEVLGTGPRVDPGEIVERVAQLIAAGDYDALRELMTHACAREVTRTRVMGVWRDILADVGALEDCSGIGATRDGISLRLEPTPGPVVARALLEHEAGEIVLHVSVNRAGRIDGILFAPPAHEAGMAF